MAKSNKKNNKKANSSKGGNVQKVKLDRASMAVIVIALAVIVISIFIMTYKGADMELIYNLSTAQQGLLCAMFLIIGLREFKNQKKIASYLYIGLSAMLFGIFILRVIKFFL